MIKRCRHEFITKDDCPEDRMCELCGVTYQPSKYLGWYAPKVRRLPREIRDEVLELRAKGFVHYIAPYGG